LRGHGSRQPRVSARPARWCWPEGDALITLHIKLVKTPNQRRRFIVRMPIDRAERVPVLSCRTCACEYHTQNVMPRHGTSCAISLVADRPYHVSHAGEGVCDFAR
ncbi:MAG TPA: hypothetical protein VH593_31150, partial [Ktedonobacteraceae bacterium]